ncbi:MAG: transglutaminase domain-containing protein [Gemmatimonadetes bacterium]|nr:transglutaminase domain-containing protein [Gemmatimonadota bacterium]MYH19360.1 transglutaminase domain-containing protein [Gemmatimonadota bacterium]
MSRLYHNESGRVIPSLCEELTRFRRVRVILNLPATGSDAVLYLLARPHRVGDNPLHWSVNGIGQEAIRAGEDLHYKWYERTVKSGDLRDGDNMVELWADDVAMTGWSLAMEAGGTPSNSALTDDGGARWRSHRLGYLNAVSGNYCVRMRLAEGHDDPAPDMVWESADHPRARSMCERIPRRIANGGDLLTRVRALSAWISTSWEHSGSRRGTAYAPWDAETILAWGESRQGHNGESSITMCVHYAVAFVSACQALGIPARCAALMGTPNSYEGHFVAEVWFEDYRKWVMVDPNIDAMMFRGGEPLSIPEIQELHGGLAPYIEWGSGSKFQRTFSHMRRFIRDSLLRGVCFQHRSIWPRADFFSHPELTPPGHGSVSYCETDLVWSQPDRETGFGMFKYFAPAAYFTAPPEKAVHA